MKKLRILAVVAVMAAAFGACTTELPEVTDPTMVAVVDSEGDSTIVAFSVNVPAGFASATVAVTSGAGTAEITSTPDVGAVEGTVTVVFMRSNDDASTVILTLTLTDSDDNTSTGTATVSVEEAPDFSTLFEEDALMDDDNNLLYNIITITDRGEGTGDYTMDPEVVYVLNGFVFVNEGQTLTIPAGTIVKGKSGQGENASALIVARGGAIEATGTAAAPIIFTTEADGIAPGEIEGTLPSNARGLWGGLIVLGSATNNNTTNSKFIEGLPATDVRSQYGGDNDADDSGTLKYISIRHGGTDIGNGNEINGLTLGSVGNGTEIDYVEVIANKDDGVEWFGGSANVSHVIVANCGDDSFDYDEGWHGNVQYAFTIQEGTGDRAGEHDGGPSDNETGMPYAVPTFANMTYVGQGSTAGTNVIELRDNAGGFFYNAIFTGFEGGVDIEDLADDKGDDSYTQLTVNNNIAFEGIQVFDIDDNFVEQDYPSDDPRGSDVDITEMFDIHVTDPQFSSAFVAANRSTGVDLSAKTTDSFFESTTEPGAFVGGAWHAEWTLWAILELE